MARAVAAPVARAGLIAAWVQAAPAAKRIILARFARSIGQGALVAMFTLYLHTLGWSAPQIGAVLSAAMLLGAALTMLIGPLSDRLGRRPFLLGYEAVAMACAAAALLSSSPWLLAPAAVVGSFGRGANGAAGPFGPLEQAWLAHGVAPAQRAAVFSLNSTLGMLGMALGALLGAAPHWLLGWLPTHWAYRAVFVLPLAGSAIGFVLLRQARDAPRAVAATDAAPARAARAETAPVARSTPLAQRQRENALLLRLALANSLNGLGIGMVAPLMAYWYLLRFGHGPGSIGPALAASFALAALGSVLASALAHRIGVVSAVVIMRAVGLALLLATPFTPLFWLAAMLWALRAAFNQGTIGVRQALTVSLTDASRRGLAATVNNVSVQIPRAIGPFIAGLLLHQGWLVAPFVLAAALQAGYLLLYRRFFGAVDPQRGNATQ